MEHIFLIDITEGTGYHNHALAALNEFLDLFPEHKNKFKVHIRSGNKFYEIPISELSKISPNLQEISYSHLDNSSIKISEINGNDEKLINGWIYNNSQKDSFFHYISLTKKSINNGMFYGVSSSLVLDGLDIPPENEEKYKKSSYVSVNTNRDPKQFKSILKHELGHAFKATHEERKSIDETDPAHHCTSSGCLMNNGLINGAARGDEPDFCSECIASMKKYINSLFNEQTRTNKTNVVGSSQELPPNAEINDEFKLPWRDFAKNLAQKMGWKYEEDEKRTNFKAGLKSADGSYTYINASSKNDVSLSAKDKDGNPKVPDMAVFKELVAKAQKDGSVIDFGDIKTPEFKARLLIACMEANPPMVPENAPALDDNFLVSIDKASAEKIKQLKAKNEENNQDNGKKETSTDENKEEAPKKTENEKTPYEESRDERKRILETKLKINAITAMEQTELNYIKQEEKRKQAKEEAIARTGNDIDPRTAEHTQQSGLSPVSYAYHSSSEREWKGWKLHLDVVPNRDNETTRAVSEFLEQLEVDHKIAKGGENGKGMTIYVGGYEDAFKLSKEIRQRFGKDIAEPPIYTDQKGEETDFNNIVTGRFYLQDIFQTQYPRSSIKGICPTDYGSLCDRRMESLVVGMARKEELVDKDYSVQNIENTNFHDRYTVTNLESYCAHKFYQKHLGELYCGRNAEDFEKRIFGDAIPPKGSDERRKWDKIAKSYTTILEQENPKCLESIQELKGEYKPIDFRKAPQITQSRRRNNGGRSS